jgi:hypothetical protein
MPQGLLRLLPPGATHLGFDPGQLAWSNRGSAFALPASYRIGGHPEGGLVVGRGTHAQAFVPTGTARPGVPTWAHDGGSFADLLFPARGLPSLVVFDAANRLPRVVLRDAPAASWAAWSPTDAWLLVADNAGKRWVFARADGTGSVSYPGLGGFPRWCCPPSPPITTAMPTC